MIFPNIDPVVHIGPWALQFGPLALRWYALAYVAGILLGWRYAIRLTRTASVWGARTPAATALQIDDLVLWITLGIILGGRIGYILFYMLMNDDQRAWLGNLRYSRTVETFMLVHATLDNPEMWGYVFDKLEAEANFAYQMCSVCFFGHTHVPLAFEKAGIVRGGLYTKLLITAGRKYYINVGSVGQPRDGDPRAAYAIYDLVQNVVELRRVEYDIAAAQQKILAAGLPARAASRLEIGR